MAKVLNENGKLVWQRGHLTVWIEPWGPDAIRVRATMNADMPAGFGILLDQPPVAAEIEIPGADKAADEQGPAFTAAVGGGRGAATRLTDGKLTVEVGARANLLFKRAGADDELLAVEELAKGVFTARDGPLWHAVVRVKAYDDERIYGMGQHRHGLLDQKGCVIDLIQHNCEVAIPFVLSSRGYGFIWNNPAIGRAEFGRSLTRWVAEATKAVDFLVITGDGYADILRRYADITGHAPMLPEWAAGFWQCKLRYKTQEELLSVAREHKKRKLPMDVIVADFFHWTKQGEWKFDPEDWPDPAAMVKELADMGVRLMVSIWPTVNRDSENFQEMHDAGLLLQTQRGVPVMLAFQESKQTGAAFPYMTDPSNPQTRRYVWGKVRENYYAHGIKVWWLDAIEPELATPFPHVDHLRYHVGTGSEVGLLFPWYQQMAFFDGMRSAGETEIITLCRSAFLGSQRFAAAVWSGDIHSSFEVLAGQVRAGLNIGLSGIPWWTTDIGGFWGGNPESEYFRELIVRWFQYGVFCPLFRLHGARAGSGNNEVWSFGEKAYEIIKELLFLRERLRPYIMAQMKTASETGLPPMRPPFIDFPGDETCYDVEDEFLFGPEILVCPVVEQGATSRDVYLPAGA
ncbi:MAG: glycoside hydrolase family 31 protein, partial [Planctomycetota bacterium]